MNADVTAVPQAAKVAAYRASGYLQRAADFPLRDYDFAVLVGKLVKNKVQQLAGYGGIYIPADFVF